MLLSWLDVTLQCYKLISIVHIMPLLVALAAEVLVPKDFIPAGFGVLLFCVLEITTGLSLCFCPMESLSSYAFNMLDLVALEDSRSVLYPYMLLWLAIWKLATRQLMQFVSM